MSGLNSSNLIAYLNTNFNDIKMLPGTGFLWVLVGLKCWWCEYITRVRILVPGLKLLWFSTFTQWCP